jgi:hypothetical protein
MPETDHCIGVLTCIGDQRRHLEVERYFGFRGRFIPTSLIIELLSEICTGQPIEGSQPPIALKDQPIVPVSHDDHRLGCKVAVASNRLSK